MSAPQNTHSYRWRLWMWPYIAKRQEYLQKWINWGLVIKNYDGLLWVCVWNCLSCLTLCNPMDYSPPGSSVHGILQTRNLECIAMPSSNGFSWPTTQTCASYVSSLAGGSLPLVPLACPKCHHTYPCKKDSDFPQMGERQRGDEAKRYLKMLSLKIGATDHIARMPTVQETGRIKGNILL